MTHRKERLTCAAIAAAATLYFVNPSPLLAQADCAATVAKFREAVAFDIKQGQLGEKVGKSIEADIARADAACRAGQAKQGLSIIARIKKQYGYAN